MNFPKIRFINIPLSIETDWIHGFLFQNEWGWGKYILKKYPKIKEVYNLERELEQVRFLKNYITEFKKTHKEKIKKNRLKYQEHWWKIEKEYFTLLSQILEVDWPEDRRTIKAMISINPICPRFLDDWSFSIFYDYDKVNYVLEVIMHECCHFLYFEKWKKLYPRTNPIFFESPHVEWHLSEIIAPIILNDQRIQKILKQKAVFYPEHSRLKINNISVPKYFTRLYDQSIARGSGCEVFVKKAYQEIKKNRALFKF